MQISYIQKQVESARRLEASQAKPGKGFCIKYVLRLLKGRK